MTTTNPRQSILRFALFVFCFCNIISFIYCANSKLNDKNARQSLLGQSVVGLSVPEGKQQHHVDRKQLKYPELVVDERRDQSLARALLANRAAYPRSGKNLEFDERRRGASPVKLIRRKRLAAGGRQNRPRVQLAQRPQKSTTTTTTTTQKSTTPDDAKTSELSAINNGDEEAADDESSGDYEEIQSASGKKLKADEAATTATKIADGKVVDEDKTGPQEDEEDQEADETEEEEAEQTTTSTTTTTTQKPATSTRSSKSRGSQAKKKVKTGASGAETTASSSTTRVPSETKSKNAPKKEKEKSQPAKESDQVEVIKDKDASSSSPPSEESNANSDSNNNTTTTTPSAQHRHRGRKKPIVVLPFLKPKNSSICTREAYLEFPPDLVGNKWRARGLVVVHIAVVCYMFYCLALVCERYFMPSLEEFAQRLNLSEDVAGATLMSAGSSAPELFTAILGVFVAKGDVGTGTIVGSAVFNILFVIGICGFVSTTSAQLQWWPVLRDSVYYAFTVLVLIIFIYDEEITAMESATMLALYGVYILVMVHNETLKEQATRMLLSNPLTSKLFSTTVVIATVDGPDDVFGSSSTSGAAGGIKLGKPSAFAGSSGTRTVEDDSMYLAACLIIVKHKRLFRSNLRFQSAARYIIIKRQHRIQQQQQKQQQQQSSKSANRSDEVNYFGPESEPLANNAAGGQRARIEAYAKSSSLSKQKFSIVSKDDYEFWNRPPAEDENYYLWLAKIPVNYVLHYTIPDCALYPDQYLITFFVSIIWTAFFSYVMVWMVTLIGFTLGIPDSVMGATFLAAGTSVPDCYSSVHAARNGMADMAVSNSIGSNVFDILIGLSLPWFIQTALYPGVVATISSRGIIYSVVLLFLSLIITIYLLNKYDWTLKPRLGLSLLITYGLFIILTCMLEFNLFGHVNPPACQV